MNTTTQEETDKTCAHPYMEKIQGLAVRCNRPDSYYSVFPNTIFTETGFATMTQCIGFLMGAFVSGKKKEAEAMAETLFNSFRLGMIDNNRESYCGMSAHILPHKNKLKVSGSSYFMCFDFLNMGIMPDQTPDAAKVDYYTEMMPGLTEFSLKYRYGRLGNGGIIFHGLQQVYAVTLDSTIGWQSHT